MIFISFVSAGALHLAYDSGLPLVPGSRAAVGLRLQDVLLDSSTCAPANSGQSAPFPLPPQVQLSSALAAFRFMDCQFAFTPNECRALLRLLRGDACADRKRWFIETCACRRRPQGKLDRLRRSGIETVLTLEDEYHLLMQSAAKWRWTYEMSQRKLGVHDLFQARAVCTACVVGIV